MTLAGQQTTGAEIADAPPEIDFRNLIWVAVVFAIMIMRRMDPGSRRALTIRLVPRMLFLMPTLSITAGTSGWFLAEQLGYFDVAPPGLYWVIAAVVILVVLTIQGLGFLLPTNVRVYLELRKDRPDPQRIMKLMRAYIYVIASQGVLQVVMIVIMARFVSGL
jgi:hypothetical protein